MVPKTGSPRYQAIKPENRWNMDEAGIIGRPRGEWTSGWKCRSAFYSKKQPGSKAWTSFIECISAMGVGLTRW